MDWKFIFIQAIGLLGSLVVMLSVQFNNRKVALAAQAVACVLWITHYSALGATTAIFINVISIARSVVFYFNDRRWAKSKLWLWLFIVLFLGNSFLAWEGWWSILPSIGMCATTIALWVRDERKLRLLYFCSSPPWLVYNILCGSYSCAIVEAVALASYISAIYRFDIRKKETKAAN